MAQREPLSLILRRQRMLYLGDVARRDATDAVRGVLFDSQSSEFKQLQAIRRRGRPRKTCIQDVLKDCLEAAGTKERLNEFFKQTTGELNMNQMSEWRRLVMKWPGDRR